MKKIIKKSLIIIILSLIGIISLGGIEFMCGRVFAAAGWCLEHYANGANVEEDLEGDTVELNVDSSAGSNGERLVAFFFAKYRDLEWQIDANFRWTYGVDGLTESSATPTELAQRGLWKLLTDNSKVRGLFGVRAAFGDYGYLKSNAKEDQLTDSKINKILKGEQKLANKFINDYMIDDLAEIGINSDGSLIGGDGGGHYGLIEPLGQVDNWNVGPITSNFDGKVESLTLLDAKGDEITDYSVEIGGETHPAGVSFDVKEGDEFFIKQPANSTRIVGHLDYEIGYEQLVDTLVKVSVVYDPDGSEQTHGRWGSGDPNMKHITKKRRIRFRCKKS